MKRSFRIAHMVVASLVLAAIVAQPFLIGMYLFGAVDTSDLHTGVGYGIFEIGIPLLLILGLLARLPRKEMLLTLSTHAIEDEASWPCPRADGSARRPSNRYRDVAT